MHWHTVPRLGKLEGRKTLLGYTLFRKERKITHRGFVKRDCHKEKKEWVTMRIEFHVKGNKIYTSCNI